MTLSLKNSEVQRFYNSNLYEQAERTEGAVSVLKDPTIALDFLEKFQMEFKSLRLLYPTATEDIRAIEKMQASLRGRVQLLIEKNTGAPDAIDDFVMVEADPTPPSASKPIGIVRRRGNQNCAYGSLLQAISNTSKLRDSFLNSDFAGFFEEYAASQDEGKPVSDIDLIDVREKLTGSRNSAHQEDAGKELGKMLEKLAGEEISFFPTDQCNYTKYKSDTLSLHYAAMSDFAANVQSSLQYVGGTPPNNVIVNRGSLASVGGSVPTYIPHKEKGYDLKSCVIQFGGASGGHFVTLQKKGNGWYLIDDAHVSKVGNRKAKKLLKQGYLYFYEKTNVAPAPSKSVVQSIIDLTRKLFRHLTA